MPEIRSPYAIKTDLLVKKTQALMGATRPEVAEKCPDARRVAPISACVWCLLLMIVLRGSVS